MGDRGLGTDGGVADVEAAPASVEVSVEDPPVSAPRASREQRQQKARRRALVLAPILLLSLLFYAWTANSAATPLQSNAVKFGHQTDAYNNLTDSFLNGHLDLLLRPPESLTSLPDPYDPVQNASVRAPFHDLVLYKGHFFVTWGPTPVVTLLLPFRLLHVGGLPVNIGVIIYCWVGLLFSVLLLLFLVDRYLKDTKTWQLGVATAALALCSVVPFLLRRAAVYELAISSAYCFAMVGAYLIASGTLTPTVRRWRVALGSLSLGLAAGGRPDLVFAGVLLVGALAFVVRKKRVHGRAEILRYTAIFLVPFGVIVALLAAYNFVRFGSFLENGTSYQLAGIETSKLPMYRLEYAVPNLYYYLIAPVRWTFAFPYFALPPPPYYAGKVPSYYNLTELTGGVLTTTPILLAIVPALIVVVRHAQRELLAVMLALLAVGTLVLLFVTAVLPSTTMRYEVDYTVFFVLPALIGWFVLTSGRARRVVAVVGTVVIVYGCLVGAAISVYGYFDALRTTHPDSYWALDRLTSPVPTVASMLVGHPVIARTFPADQQTSGLSGTYRVADTQFPLTGARQEVDIISPNSGDWILGTFARTPEAANASVLITVQQESGAPRYIPIPVTGPTGIGVRLHRGLNRVQISANSQGPLPIPYPVWVSGLRLWKQKA